MTNTPNAPAHLAGNDAPGVVAALLPVSALLVSVSLLLAGNGLQNTLIPVRGNIESFGELGIGLLGSSYFLGFTVGCHYGARLISRAGHIRTYLAMVSLASSIVLVHAFAVEPIVWWVLRAITGFCFAVLFIVIESWINEKSTNATRGTVFSIYTMITLTVISLGQMMLALADPKDFALFALASVLVSLAALPVAFTTVVTPAPVPFVRANFRKTYTNSPVGVAGCFAIGLTNGAFWSVGPVFAQDRGFSTTEIGLFMSAVVIGGALAQYPLGLLSDRVDRRKVMIATASIALIASVAIALLVARPFVQVLLLGALYGAAAFPLYALATAHANDHADQSDFVTTSSSLLLVFGAGAALGPLAVTTLQSAYGGPVLFKSTAAINLVLVGFLFWRLSRSERPAAKDRVDFSESLIATETVIPYEIKLPENLLTKPSANSTDQCNARSSDSINQ